MTMEAWPLCVDDLLRAMKEIDFGYPFDCNEVRPCPDASSVESILRQVGLLEKPGLRDFYSYCDGISWPDVHSGYWICRLQDLVRADRADELSAISGPFADEVVTIGTNGGGERFVVAKTTGAVLFLPHGPLHSGVYDDYDGRVRQVAHDFRSFLQQLLDDLTAFVRGTPGHRFIY